ncbi:MAG: NAD-dependent aldehyde dehydrogenase [Microbacterium sp.]|nr:NAD-dependent aldehyde dehydrogenase [Microbacterium sp.]
MRVLRNVVDGVAVASTGPLLDLVSPVTGAVYAQAPVSTAAEVDAAVAAAAAAFSAWKRATPAERQLALFRLADAVEARAEEFADLESEDTGKPRASLVADEVVQSVDQLRFFAGAARELNGRAAAEYAEGFTSYVRREPIGVVAQVTPWNYPLNMAGVLNVVLGDRDTGRALVEHPTPQLVAITGSVRAGMQVAASAAHDLKRVHLELGGKAPAIVFPDADLEAAASGIAEAAFFNAGQDCTAATRLLVHASLHDAFVERLVAYVEQNVRVGAPDDPEAFFGPVNNPDQLARVEGFIERLPAHAQVATGGARVGDTGCFFPPTVVTGLRQDDELVQQEVFGPVLSVQVFETEEEALALANGVPYALAASVWTRDNGRALRLSRDLDFGCVWINAHIPFVSDMPHGGFKHSGYGKDLSIYGFEDYTRLKHVMASLG